MTDKVFVRCGLSSGRLFCSTSIASLVQVRAMSSRRSRTRMLDAMAICRHSAARSLHTSEVSMAVTPTAVLPGTPTSLGSAGFPTIEEALPDGPQAPPNRPRLRHRQGPPGLLHRLLRRMGCWSHLRDPRRSRQSALVLVTGPMKRSDRVATLDEAKAQFQMSWDAWKAWATLEEVPGES